MVRTRRESHQSNGITDPKSLQPSFATKSAVVERITCKAEPGRSAHVTREEYPLKRNCGLGPLLKAPFGQRGVLPRGIPP